MVQISSLARNNHPSPTSVPSCTFLQQNSHSFSHSSDVTVPLTVFAGVCGAGSKARRKREVRKVAETVKRVVLSRSSAGLTVKLLAIKSRSRNSFDFVQI